MSTPVSSLPEPWVERIWSTMRATYGATFDRQWQCPENVEPAQHVAELKAVWGRGLAGLQQNPQAISFALENLPEFPPNLQQFKTLCARRPDSAQLAIGRDRPAPNPERLAELRAKLDAIGGSAGVREMAQSVFARLHAAREMGTLSPAQRDFLQRAEAGLNGETAGPTQSGPFTPPPEHALPPGMRKDQP
jgi:hypothetical protein